MKEFFTGSICLSDIPENLIKYVKCKDGKVRAYVNVALMPMREPKTFKNGDRTTTHTHFLTCAPRKEDRVDGVNYIIGNFEERAPQAQPQPQPQPQTAQVFPSRKDSFTLSPEEADKYDVPF